MRPLKLTMSAFGPYAGQTTVDFDALGTTGFTSSPATPAPERRRSFDAIAYALYGEASGETRESPCCAASMPSPRRRRSWS